MARGGLRIFLGAVAGVGKTYAMLNEAWRRHSRGIDVVVGFVEPHGRPETAEQIRDLEVIARKRINYRGTVLEEMDVDAILARHPQVALVDELAHTNVPGSKHPKRWQDVAELLDAGIDVVSTLNIQHLESLNDVVEHITGVKQHETIPDEVVRRAEEIQLVELTPEALRRRLAHGDIYPPDRIDTALANFFRPGNLGALRELALMWVADRVDEALHDYMADHDIHDTWETRERVLVALTGSPQAEHVIRRAARLASRAHGELIGVHIRAEDGLEAPETSALADHRHLLESLDGRFIEVFGDDIADTLLTVAREEHATQVVLGASRRSRWTELVRGSVIGRVIRDAGDIDVHVISSPADQAPRSLPSASLLVVSARRRWIGLAFSLLTLPALTALLLGLQPPLELSGVLLLYLTLTVVATAIGGGLVAIPTGIAAVALADFYFTAPHRTFIIADAEVVIAIAVFAIVTTLVSWLVDRAARQARDARRSSAEAAALARITSMLTSAKHPLPALVDDLVRTFGLDGATVLHRSGDTWQPEATAGNDPPGTPDDATDVITISSGHVLAVTGRRAPADDRRVLASYAGQLAVAVAARQLEQEAAQASVEADSSRLRAALLASVSHDLRTPLSAIKAYGSSLLQDDVTWRRSDIDEFAHSIVEEADRLNALIGNLLDMSRLETDDVSLHLQAVGLDDLVPAVLHTLPYRHAPLTVDLPTATPPAWADAQLLERILCNLVDNALRWSPPGHDITVRTSNDDNGRIRLEVVDHGTGVAPQDLERVFHPFQRLGDGTASGQGVGLGLAVARGFARAMGGDVHLEPTPGGGTTAVVELATAPAPTPRREHEVPS